jgi:hypothetical protein
MRRTRFRRQWTRSKIASGNPATQDAQPKTTQLPNAVLWMPRPVQPWRDLPSVLDLEQCLQRFNRWAKQA